MARWNHYLKIGQELMKPERISFLGFLNHNLLSQLFPCCDAAVFPSKIPEAGPLVFLESLASHCFPLGTYFGGMAAHIDQVSQDTSLPLKEQMGLNPGPGKLIEDLIKKIPGALTVNDSIRAKLRRVVEDRYDWDHIAQKWAHLLHHLSS